VKGNAVARSPINQTRRAAWCVVAAAFLALSGCGSDGLSYRERQERRDQQVSDTLQQKGVKLSSQMVMGQKAWNVNLSGLTITNELLDDLKKLDIILELDMSKCQLTDELVARIGEEKIAKATLKFDLSHTAVTDAGFDKLTSLFFLSQMNLVGTKVTPAAVERFKKERLKDPKIMMSFRKPTIRLN
jgi:hypothetical protein